MSGWIKLHRSLLEWEWYDDINVRLTFIHCLMSANYEDKKWQGTIIKRGTFVTGRDVLANEIGISVRQVRTALTKLKSTNDLTIKTTSKGTLVAVVKYNKFQARGDESTSKSTSKSTSDRPANDQQTTTTKKLKKEKKVVVQPHQLSKFIEDQPQQPTNHGQPTQAEVMKMVGSTAYPLTSECAESYYLNRESTGWMKRNQPITNWRADLALFASHWSSHERNKIDKAEPKHHITEYIGD